MTTVYGVTFIGARDQIHRQLKNAEDHGSTDIYPWANYLAKVVSIISLIKVIYLMSYTDTVLHWDIVQRGQVNPSMAQ